MISLRENGARVHAGKRQPICDDPLECGSRRESRAPQAPRKRRFDPALPDILAADFRFHLPPRLFDD